MKVTFQQVIVFRNNAFTYQQKHAGKFSPFLYAITKLIGRTEKNVEEYNEKVQEINQKLCDRDKDGFFKMDNPGTPAQSFKIPADKFAEREALVKALNKSETDVEPHILKDVIDNLPSDIDFNWWQYMAPFVLPELTDEIVEQLYAKQTERDALETA